MSELKKVIMEMAVAKLSEAEVKQTPLHSELKDLHKDTYYEGGGSASVSTTMFRGPKNTHFDKVHKMILDRGYKKVHADRNGTEYHKDLDGGKKTAKVNVNHDGKHVYSVGTITYRNHY
jgi:hypothetical protein